MTVTESLFTDYEVMKEAAAILHDTFMHTKGNNPREWCKWIMEFNVLLADKVWDFPITATLS